jgi:hypothetical protein
MKKPKKKKPKAAIRVSLHPLTPEDALKKALGVPAKETKLDDKKRTDEN